VATHNSGQPTAQRDVDTRREIGEIGWDALVTELGQPGTVRRGLGHTALTWMADAGVDLHILQQVAGHQDPAVTARYWAQVRRSDSPPCHGGLAPQATDCER
jgi:integrase